MGTEEQGRKRNREETEDGNTVQEIQHKERKRKKKKERREEAQQQAEEQRQLSKKPQESSANESKVSLLKTSTLNKGEGEDQDSQLKIVREENGKKEKKKKEKLNIRVEEVKGEGDLDKDIVEAEQGAEKKKKKKKKEKGIEQLEETNMAQGIAEEPKEDREEETSEEERRTEEKKRKIKKRKKKEDEEEDSQNKNGTLLNGVKYNGLNNDYSNREPEKKKEKNRKKVTFEDEIVVADYEQVSDVSYADQEEVSDVLNESDQSGNNESSKDEDEEIWGQRFTPEEDEILKEAVWTYIKSKGWDEHSGLEKVLNSNKHRDARNCWAEIKMCLPQRPRQAIRFRAHVLLESGGHLGKWSKEEEDFLKRLQSERGHKWREFSVILNRQRNAIKEKWRSLKRCGKSEKNGGWTQDELQKLFKMVHESLRMNRLLATKKEKLDRHILRDNIAWEKIADTIGTHNHGPCCSKWYYNLQSSLVADGLWANQDDFLLLESLLESGASAEEEVEWDNLLEHRSGQICLTRWKQMVKHLGENRTRQFLDKLDILARRYAPELLETSVEDNTSKELPSGTDQAS